MFESTLMIRVESRRGGVAVESFLRAARELSFVAAEVGRASIANRGIDELSQHAATLHISIPNDSTGHDLFSNSWHIVDVQCSRFIGATTEDFTTNDRSSGKDNHNTGKGDVALVIAPPNGQGHTARKVREGIRAIHSRCDERPNGFTDAVLRSLRRVAAMSGPQLRVTVSAGRGEGEAIALDENVVAQIDAWLSGQSESLGSVEGSLEIISIHNRLRFTVYEKSSSQREGARIECLFPEMMLAQVKGALGERVCIRGRVRYRKDGVPATVQAYWLRVLRPLQQLPTIEVMVGCGVSAAP